MKKTQVAKLSELQDRVPVYALVSEVDLVVVKYDDEVTVLYGRCLHRGALMSDGSVVGDNLVCGLHGWDYRLDTGVSEYNNSEALHKFTAIVDADTNAVYVDESEIRSFAEQHPQPYQRSEYLGLYQDPHGGPEETSNHYLQTLAKKGIEGIGHHGWVSAMGVPIPELPRWDDLQIVTAQLARQPLLDDEKVENLGGDRPQRSTAFEVRHSDIRI